MYRQGTSKLLRSIRSRKINRDNSTRPTVHIANSNTGRSVDRQERFV
jgi:hypothetical protein